MSQDNANNKPKSVIQPAPNGMSIEDFKEYQKQLAQPASQTQPTQYDQNGNAIFPETDVIGQPNKSRGIIGLVGGSEAGKIQTQKNKL